MLEQVGALGVGQRVAEDVAGLADAGMVGNLRHEVVDALRGLDVVGSHDGGGCVELHRGAQRLGTDHDFFQLKQAHVPHRPFSKTGRPPGIPRGAA